MIIGIVELLKDILNFKSSYSKLFDHSLEKIYYPWSTWIHRSEVVNPTTIFGKTHLFSYTKLHNNKTNVIYLYILSRWYHQHKTFRKFVKHS